MTRADDLQNHRLHNVLDKILDTLEATDWKESSENTNAKIRVNKLVKLIKSTLESIDPDFIPSSTLEKFTQQIDQLLNSTVNAKQRTDANYINNFFDGNNYANLFVSLSSIVAMSPKIKISPTLKTIENEAIKTSNSLQKSKQLLQALDASLANLTNKISSTDKQITELATNWQKAFLDAQNSRNDEYSKNLNSLKVSWNEELENFLETKTNSFESTIQDNINFMTEKKDDIQNIHEKVKELHNLVANDSVSGGYLGTSDKENKKANIFRWLGVATMIGAISWAMLIFFLYDFSTYSGANSNSLFIFKIVSSSLITILFVTVGSYFLSLSSKHSNIAIWAKQTELEVKAIDPFISNLPESIQMDLKRFLTERIFGQVKNPFSPDKEEKILIQKNYEEVISIIKRLNVGKKE